MKIIRAFIAFLLVTGVAQVQATGDDGYTSNMAYKMHFAFEIFKKQVREEKFIIPDPCWDVYNKPMREAIQALDLYAINYDEFLEKLKQPELSLAALILAAEFNNRFIAQLALANDADINGFFGLQGITPLITAVGYNPVPGIDTFEMVKFLVSHGADVNRAKEGKMSPLFHAASAEIASFLIDKGADVNQTVPSGITPLARAAWRNRIFVVKELLKHNALVNVEWKHPSGQMCTPLMMAARLGDLEMMQLLIDHGADVNYQSPQGGTVLSEAILSRSMITSPCNDIPSEKNILQCLEILIQNGLTRETINVINSDGFDVLRIAVDGNDQSVVRKLLEHGANANERYNDPYYSSPLMNAVLQTFQRPVQESDLETIQLLIHHGADINQRNSLGETAVYILAKYGGSIKLLEMLVRAGAAVNIPDNEGITPMSIALSNKQKAAYDYLARHGGKIYPDAA